MASEILPSKNECLQYIIETALHSCGYHYYIHQLGLSPNDPKSEFPHDLSGKGNKYEWEVMRGLALNGNTPEILEAVNKSLIPHRQQYHHKMWNGRDYNPDIPVVDLQSGAADTILALREPRVIYGGPYTFDEILKLETIINNPPYKLEMIQMMVEKMRNIPFPKFGGIDRLSKFPEEIKGMPQKIYQDIYHRALDARVMVELKYPHFKSID